MALNSDLQALREYVTAETGAQNQAESTVRLPVTHSNLQAKFMEIRLDLHMTIGAVKNKLCFHCGTSPSAMILQLKNETGSTILATLSDDARKLGYYSPKDGYILHIIDADPTSVSANGWLEDVSKVDKYVMSDEDYEKRENTYRRFKQERLKADPTWTIEKEIATRKGVPYIPPSQSGIASKTTDDPEYMAEDAAQISGQIGARCEVQSLEGSKRGVVKFIGKVEGLPLGWWIGVQYDEPVGKNDGSAKGKRYFECPAGYGAFVRPNLVKIGDYPPFDEDFEFSDGDEI